MISAVMIGKEKFEYYESHQAWIYESYFLTDDEYNKVSFRLLNSIISKIQSNSNYLETAAQAKLFSLVKEIDFLSKEELESIFFEYMFTGFQLSGDGEVIKYIRNYSLSGKLYQDIYGVWEVTFEGLEIVKAERVNG
ncbi:hypothetical protein [Reichenbachiella versicolor]|uniref:hypothetical protein n=1 Tax=Reichenbachiella versicolor TaxID=1821036 RepID=UPI000D6E945B|nr:hypothetical protein [Reichenbachiella versicolor]